MTPESAAIWSAVLGAILGALFSNVVAQYLFSPWLDARKERLLARQKYAAALSDALRRLSGNFYMMQGFKDDRGKLLVPIKENMGKALLDTTDITLVQAGVMFAQRMFEGMLDDPDAVSHGRAYFSRLSVLYDPVTVPLARSWHRSEALALLGKLEQFGVKVEYNGTIQTVGLPLGLPPKPIRRPGRKPF